MAAITNTAVTKQGLAALAYSKVQGLPIVFTKMALGDGYISGTAEDQTGLINTVLTYDVSNIERHENSQVWVECSMSNNDLTAGFYYREIGLYCKNPENEDEEILYCYGNAGDKAEYVVADNSTTAVSKTIRLILNIANDQAVTVNMNDENHATNNYVNAKVAAEEAARMAEKTNCLIEAPQHLTFDLVKGTLALVGSVSVDNSGVMSDFATTRHANIPQLHRYVDGTYIFKFTTSADITSSQIIVHAQSLFTLGISAGVLESYSFSQYQNTTISTIAANTTYWVKVVLNGMSKDISISTDGSTYGAAVTIEDLAMSAAAAYPIRLGCSSYDTSLPFLGKIDSACQIFRNNVLIYTGKVGGITLKGGSKVYRTTATGIIPETLPTDYRLNFVGSLKSGKLLLIWTGNSLWSAPVDWCYSKPKSERPTKVDNAYAILFYATDEKIMYLSGNQGVDWFSENYTLPLAELTVVDGIITDYVPFNGFGYIGSVVFALPGVKGLIPNGRNIDGTLKNINHTVSKVIIQDFGAGAHTGDVSYFIGYNDTIYDAGAGYYISKNNYIIDNWSGAVSQGFVFAEGKRTDGAISTLTPKHTFRAVDYSDFNREQEKLEALINEKDFEIESIGRMIELDLTKLFIQIFKDTSMIDSSKGDGAYCIANYYDADKHIFIKDDVSTKTIYSVAKTVTNGNNQVWAKADWKSVENGTINLEISRDGGTTWTTIPQGELTNISSQPAGSSMVLRVTVTGRLKLKNIAWGMKA